MGVPFFMALLMHSPAPEAWEQPRKTLGRDIRGMAKNRQRPKQKHVPQRTCVACRETKAKRDLVRVVLLAEGGIAVDETGKRNGRGAYLCRNRTCWEQAVERGSLSRALRVSLQSEDVTTLEAFAKSLVGLSEEDKTST